MQFSFKATVCVVAMYLGVATSVQAADQTLRIGTEPTFAPFEFTDSKNRVMGYDIDIINAIAKEEGLTVEIVSMPFDGLIPALMTSQIDAAIAGITITEERAKKVSFSEPYYNSGLSAVILKENQEQFKKLADLKTSRICGQIGNVGVDYAKELSGNVAAFNTHPEAFMELKAKGCSAVITDRPVNQYFLAQQKDDSYVEIPELADAAQFGIAVKKSNDELLKKIDDGLQKIRDKGIFKEIHMKWFNSAE